MKPLVARASTALVCAALSAAPFAHAPASAQSVAPASGAAVPASPSPAEPAAAAPAPSAAPAAPPAAGAEAPAAARPAAARPAAARPAAGKGDPYAGLPKVIVPAIRKLEAECRAEEGTAQWSPDTVYSVVNVSPDGRPDYLIDTHAMTCDSGLTPWIGSDGFRYILFVSRGKNRWVKALDRGVRVFEIVDGNPPRLELLSHYAYCTLPNPDRWMRCSQTYEWRRGKLRKVAEEWMTQ